MNNYIKSVMNYIVDFFEWTSDLYHSRQQNVFGITPYEDILEDY